VDENHFLFSVSDNGQGIDISLHEKIFEPFQRGSLNKIRASGAGVGLALCRAIASAHNGELKVECPREGGSKFVLSLPLRELPAQQFPEIKL
jgi:two-component system sensor histidine kinase KdpD